MLRLPIRRSLLLALGLAAGCATPCEQLADRFCRTCEDITAGADTALSVSCRCVAQGTLAQADAPEGYFASDTEAAIACDEILLNLQFVGEDRAATCEAGLALLREEGPDACERVAVPAFSL